MKVRFTIAAALLTAVCATQASASVLSASNSTGRVHDPVDYMNVTTVQNEMNASLKEMTDATAAPAPFSSSGPALGSTGGFLVDSNIEAADNGLDIGADGFGGIGVTGGMGGQWSLGGGTGSSLFGGSKGGNGGSNHGSRGGNRGGGGGGGGGGDKGGAQAAPEPSTWMLLGTGLVMFGLYAGMRRRQTVSL